ncbi:MAG: hypothetical protein FJ221_10460 [Lentisphaerae bacterium]|nr:hypothetical protein [Lentisphaerota bacterium]
MMTRTIKSAALALMGIAMLGNAPAGGAESDLKALARENSAFALSLYGRLAPAEGNVFFSPYSISSAMGMTYAGARENTAAEMAKALEFTATPDQLPAAFKSLNAAVQAGARHGGHTLNIANGLCLTGGNVRNDFTAVLRDNFDAELFAGGVDKINGWVKAKTEGKIEKILEELSPNSVCVLLNAIYFKGTWASRFQRKATQDAPFRLATGKEVTVPLMYQKGEFKLLEKDGFQALVMPYLGKTLSMVIILPKAADGLAALEKSLTAETLALWLAEADHQAEREAQIFVPRFKLETGYDLVPPCQALGIKDAFDADKADFRGMGWPKGELWIAQIKHKAYVDVNEEGTEAAGATAVEMIPRSARRYPVFRANHPFLFVIRDQATGSILFLGRLSDPTKQEARVQGPDKAVPKARTTSPSKVDRLFGRRPGEDASPRAFPDLTWEDIPDLVQRVGNKNLSRYCPTNIDSSVVRLEPVPEGIVAAWLIEGVLIGGKFPSLVAMTLHGEEGADGYSTDDVAKVSAIYRAWWEKAKDLTPQQAQAISPKTRREVRWR